MAAMVVMAATTPWLLSFKLRQNGKFLLAHHKNECAACECVCVRDRACDNQNYKWYRKQNKTCWIFGFIHMFHLTKWNAKCFEGTKHRRERVIKRKNSRNNPTRKIPSKHFKCQGSQSHQYENVVQLKLGNAPCQIMSKFSATALTNEYWTRRKSAQNKKRIKSNPIWLFVFVYFPLLVISSLDFIWHFGLVVDGSVYFLRYAFIHLMKSNGFQYFLFSTKL